MEALQLIIGALVTIASQYVGYVALKNELAKKADKATTDDHEKRIKVVEAAHGGIVR